MKKEKKPSGFYAGLSRVIFAIFFFEIVKKALCFQVIDALLPLITAWVLGLFFSYLVRSILA